jgi:hypothetical protein
MEGGLGDQCRMEEDYYLEEERKNKQKKEEEKEKEKDTI